MIPGVKRYVQRRQFSIEAIVWTGENFDAVRAFTGPGVVSMTPATDGAESRCVISTMYGTAVLEPGMVVLKGASGRVSYFDAVQFADVYRDAPEEPA